MLRSLENVAFAVSARKNGYGGGTESSNQEKTPEVQSLAPAPPANNPPETFKRSKLQTVPSEGDDFEEDAPLLTTAETIAEGHIYLNEHPRRRPVGAEGPTAEKTLTDLVGGTVNQRKGAHISARPSYHSTSKDNTPSYTTGNKSATSATYSSMAKSKGVSLSVPPPLLSTSDPAIENTASTGPTPSYSQIVFGSDTEESNRPQGSGQLNSTAELQRTAYGMPKRGISVPTSSASCNIDHDDDMVRKIVMAYAQRQLGTIKSGQPSNNAVEDIFMRSVMSMTKLPEATKGNLGMQNATTSRNRPSILAPTKIPVNHWVLRETLYDAKPTRGKQLKEDASVFTDLRQNKRTIVFPSANPNNRPEVYYLAQTLDLMFGSIPNGYHILASGEECYKILEPARDAELSEETQPRQPVFPQVSTAYYDTAQRLWEVLDAGLTEISRQISPACAERGALLEALRTVAKDVGTTSLEVMQFCKEEVRSLLLRENELEEQLAARDKTIESLTHEVALLRGQIAATQSERSELEEIKARYEAMKHQVHLGTAMLIRDNRLPEVLAAIEAGDTTFLERARDSKSLETNPHLSLLASGVAGIDIASVKTILEELGPIAGGMRRVGAPPVAGSGAQNEVDEDGNIITDKNDPTGADNPEMYHEAVKYLLTLDEAVRAIDLACLPFYQRALFDNPALCVSVASGKWRTIAKAIGRHEMILEQREKQWREAVKVIRNEELASLQAAGMDVSLMTGNASQFSSLRQSQLADPVAAAQAAMLLEGSVMERQIHFMQQFRSNTRKLLGAAFFGTESGGGPQATNKKSPLRGDNGGLVIGSQSASPDAKKNAESFLNAKLMLPATYSLGAEGLAAMFKDTRAVMIEIVQRLCALATSAQLKELSRPPMLPPTEPDEPCPLCSRVHIAEIQKRRRDEAMVALAEAAEAREGELNKQIEAVKKELDEANVRIARALRQSKELQSRTATLEKQNNTYLKELQVLRDWGMGVDGQPNQMLASPSLALSGVGGRSGSQGSANLNISQSSYSKPAEEASSDDEEEKADYQGPSGEEGVIRGGSRKKAVDTGVENGTEEGDVNATPEKSRSPKRSPRGRKSKDPIVIELVINCSCCGGGVSTQQQATGSSVALKTQSLIPRAPRPQSGRSDTSAAGGPTKGSALARLMGGFAAVASGGGGGGGGKPSSNKALLSGNNDGDETNSLHTTPSAGPSHIHWKGGGTKVAGIPSDPTELLQAISQGMLGGTDSAIPTVQNNFSAEGPISMRQAAAAMGIKAKRSSAVPSSAMQGDHILSVSDEPDASLKSPRSFHSTETVSNRGSQVLDVDVPTAAKRTAATKNNTVAETPTNQLTNATPIPGVSDLGLYGGEEDGNKEKDVTKTTAFWNYVGKAIGGAGSMGSFKEGDEPERFPVNPQYAKVRSRVQSLVGPLAPTGTGKPGVNYPLVTKNTREVLRNLLNEDDTTEAVSVLRSVLRLGEYDGRRAPKSLGWLLKFMTQFYKSKLVADLVAMHHRPMIASDGSGLATPAAFLHNMLQNIYGHKAVIASTSNDLAIACASYCNVDPRVSQFVRFLTDNSTLTDSNGTSKSQSQPIYEASRSLFFFSRLSRAVDNCTTGLSYSVSTASFCHDEDQTSLQMVSLARIQAVLQQTELIKKPYANALWDVVGASSTMESEQTFRAALIRNGYTLLQDEPYPKDWPEDTMKRARMTCPKIVFLAAATQFEAILREQQVAESSPKGLMEDDDSRE